jgi:hypothetical protein
MEFGLWKGCFLFVALIGHVEQFVWKMLLIADYEFVQ